jgi:octaprenyl-diphosphate synthase
LRAPFIALERYEPQLHTILEEMGTLLGQLFQRSDDLLDYDIRNNEGKAVLGDLKSGYLNSFAAFATRSLLASERQKLKDAKTLEDFQQVIGGKAQFDQAVKEFDEKNIFLIQLYQHHLKNLSHYLSDSEKPLLSQLEPLTEILYWRRKPS